MSLTINSGRRFYDKGGALKVLRCPRRSAEWVRLEGHNTRRDKNRLSEGEKLFRALKARTRSLNLMKWREEARRGSKMEVTWSD